MTKVGPKTRLHLANLWSRGYSVDFLSREHMVKSQEAQRPQLVGQAKQVQLKEKYSEKYEGEFLKITNLNVIHQIVRLLHLESHLDIIHLDELQ